MITHLFTTSFVGIAAKLVDVQVHITPGIPHFLIVGLPGKAIAESRERVRSAFAAMGLSLPSKRIVVNLAPADLPKEGSHYDLPIALGLLKGLGLLEEASLEDYIILGELALNGAVVATGGTLAAAITALEHDKNIICPASCAQEALWSGLLKSGKKILAPKYLVELMNHFKGTQMLDVPTQAAFTTREGGNEPFDMKDVKGHADAKYALEVAAAGGHNMLMVGPPGVGKSMLARRLPSLLPPLDTRDILEVSLIQSISGSLTEKGPSHIPPFRAPHHSASMAALIGGGKRAGPGEVSLAHRGVLFLDELPEFPRHVLDSLRQPIEMGEVTISRAASHVTYPAQFQLIAAMNPCRCGWAQDAQKGCHRMPACVREYQSKISGPLWDRFDMVLLIQPLTTQEITQAPKAQSSEVIRQRVTQARALQKERYTKLLSTQELPPLASYCNAHLSGIWLEAVTRSITPGAKALLERACEKLALTMRGYCRMMRLNRTLADLEGKEQIDREHIAQAITFSPNPSYFKAI